MAHGAQEDSQQDQGERPPEGMVDLLRFALAACRSAGQRERERHSHQKRERRLNHVVERAALPADVALVMAHKSEKGVARDCLGDIFPVQHLGQHQQHHKASVGIQ